MKIIEVVEFAPTPFVTVLIIRLTRQKELSDIAKKLLVSVNSFEFIPLLK